MAPYNPTSSNAIKSRASRAMLSGAVQFRIIRRHAKRCHTKPITGKSKQDKQIEAKPNHVT
jgi:hypothetical protein